MNILITKGGAEGGGRLNQHGQPGPGATLQRHHRLFDRGLHPGFVDNHDCDDDDCGPDKTDKPQ